MRYIYMYKVLTVILSKRQLLVSGVIIQQRTFLSRVLLPLLFLPLFQTTYKRID